MYHYLTGNLDCLLPFLNTTINWRAKPLFIPFVYSAYLSIIIPTTRATCPTFCFLTLPISLSSMMYTCWCPLTLNLLFVSLKCSYLLQNQITYLIFLKSSSFDYLLFHNALSPYHSSSVCNKTSADAPVGRLVVAVTQAIQTAVPVAYLQKCKFPA